ncbi:MAG: S49 family peptidase [Desulfobacteraceae bacterium]|nr:S49 family peptidase [Desulfobacteraceae bacterium]MBU3948959.1 S49 family peptidase [Pseudomonadota bacterium]
MFKMNENHFSPFHLIQKPLAVSIEAAREILVALNNQNTETSVSMFEDSTSCLEVSDGLAVISVNGGMVYKRSGWSWRTSYMDLRKDFRSAIKNPDVKAILFDLDTPGGDIAGVFDFADEIYNSREIKPIYAMANEKALSAGYLIASATDKIFLSRTAIVGSIGIIAVHEDLSSYNEKFGVKYTTVYAGEKVNERSSDAPLSDRGREAIQKQVDYAYQILVEAVARNRKLDQKMVNDTMAGLFSGGEAVQIGLADTVSSFEGVVEEIFKTPSNGKA